MTATKAIPAIPTKFNSTQFRSRLEARWAAFFEILCWDYVYEPFDADGYIPDFVITFPARPPLLVEVKPAVTHDDYLTAANATFRGLGSFGSQWKHGVIIVGVNPYYQWDRIVSAGCYFHSGKEAIAAWWMFSDDSRNSCYIKPSYVSSYVRGEQVHKNILDKWWREAGNQVQWQKSK